MELYDRFKDVSEKNAIRPALYYKEGKKWLCFSFCELLRKIDAFSLALKSVSCGPGDRVAIMCENRPEWIIGDFAINKLGAISVPIHYSSNKPLVKFILDDSDSGFLIASRDLYEKNKSVIAGKRYLKIIIVGDGSNLSDNCLSFDKLLSGAVKHKNGEKAKENTLNSPSSIVYTSGTTGVSKGVVLTNENFLFNIKASLDAVQATPKDKFLSFLPLSHVLERTVGNYAALFSGASIAYAESIKKVRENFKEVKPTIIISVPKIFEKMYEEILTRINAGNKIVKNFFYKSLSRREGSIVRRIADIFIYRKLRGVFGGNLKFAISGGAALNERITRFFSLVGIRIYEGYGLTETAPVVSTNKIGGVKIGTVGQPLFGVQIKIADDKEILVRGPNVASGYWNNKQADNEAFFEDGWLRTGDLGFLDQDNYLIVIGRKKELITTSNGKNVSPERIEGLFNMRPAILQSLVVGQGRKKLAAFIIPNYKEIEKILKRRVDLDSENNEFIRSFISREVEKVNQQLMPHERIHNYKILNRPFSLENNELTPTLKLRRLHLTSKLKEMIDDLYI